MPEDGMIHTPYINKRFNEFNIDNKHKHNDHDIISLKESTCNTSSIHKSKSVDTLSKRKKLKKKSVEEVNPKDKSKNNKTNEDDLCEEVDEVDNANDECNISPQETDIEVPEKKPIN